MTDIYYILNKIKDDKDFKAFLVNFKRLNNILKSKDLSVFSDVNINLFQTDIERDLYTSISSLKIISLNSQLELNSQEKLFNKINELQIPINLFFDNIVVNHEDQLIRENRLKLMFRLKELIINYSNFDIIED